MYTKFSICHYAYVSFLKFNSVVCLIQYISHTLIDLVLIKSNSIIITLGCSSAIQPVFLH